MKTWTKSGIFTNLSLFILLATRFPLTELDEILVRLFNGSAHPSWVESFRLLQGWSFYFYRNCAFVLVGIVILVNWNNLNSLNIDRLFINIFLISGFVYCRYYFLPLGWAAGLISFAMLISESKKRYKFGSIEPQMLRIILMILIGFTVGLLLLRNSFSITNIRLIIYFLFTNLLPFGVLEEVIFRGLLWKFLKTLKWSEPWVVVFQAILFWLVHTEKILTEPISFWIVIPVISILLGMIVWRYRSITPSTFAHILWNILRTFR